VVGAAEIVATWESENQLPPLMGALSEACCGHGDPAYACDLSVVIPVFNEVDNVAPLHAELVGVLETLELDYEILYVDDGSSDGSLTKLRSVTADSPRVTIIQMRRNFGQTAAMAAGIDRSRGRVIVPMDADMQNDPRDIPALLAKLNEPPGYDIVSGWRKNRHDKWLSRRVPSQLANWLIRKSTGVRLHDFGCTLKAYRREVLHGVTLSSELHRFLPALAVWHGAKITELEVNHRPRMRGQTKYDLRRSMKVLLDLVTVKFLGTYMNKPLYFFGKQAMLIWLAAALFLGVAVGQKYGHFGQPDGLNLNRNILVALSALLAFLGVQCVLLGTVCELLVRIYHETRGLPIYRVRQVYQLAGSARPARRRTRPRRDGDLSGGEDSDGAGVVVAGGEAGL